MPDIVQKTLNPLPNSILIPAANFSGKFITFIPTKNEQKIENLLFLWYGASGDLNNDGYPEILLTGQSVIEPNPPSIPVPTPIYLFSTNSQSTELLNSTQVFGVDSTAGTSSPKILDLNNDGRNDFAYFGFNEHPFYPTTSEIFIQQGDGSFRKTTVPGPKISSHNSNSGDFNGDGFTDFVASSYMSDGTYFNKNFYLNLLSSDGTAGGLLTLYINDKTGNFSPYAFRYTKPSSEGWTFPDYFGGGSASAFADFDNDGKSEIVMVDVTPNTAEPKDPKWQRGDTFILSNITLGDHEGWGTLTKLPSPYFEDKAEYTNLPYFFRDAHSHDIKVLPFDVNNDGLMDILVSSIVWSPGLENYAGVMQILLNKGGLQFEDVTDTSLYNYFLGKPSAHDPVLMDINHDGFVDIIMPDGAGQMNAQAEAVDKTWGNHILINTGTGKFVQVGWNELHALTMSERNLIPPEFGLGGIQEQKMTPYLLPDGRLGFLAAQPAVGTMPGYAFFDFRLSEPLSTGPNGIDPASKGVPGYSEYFYLTQYPEVVEAIKQGKYENGLDHYLKEGKTAGYFAFASNASIHDANTNDTLIGREGAETFSVSGGNDFVDGRDGIDTVIYSQSLGHYRISLNSNGYQIQDKTLVDGLDTLQNVEVLKFADFTMNLMVKNLAKSMPTAALQKIEELYVAFFNRTPDADGLAYWIGEYKKGVTIDKIAETFYTIGASAQFASLTGFSSSMTNNEFINLFYKNVLGRVDGADAGGLAYWSGKLSDGSSTRSSLASDILNAAHTFKSNQDLGWVADLLDNKILVANKIAIDFGLNFVSDAYTHGVAIAAAVTPSNIDAAIALVGISPLDIQIT